MPNRLIRDELLESERVLSLPLEGRWFFLAILLTADDLGLFEATTFKLARKADVRRDLGDALLNMLVDRDLVRLYRAANGKTYGYVPRFRQRLQLRRGKHPLPPEALFSDEPDVANKIKHLASKSTDAQPQSTDVQPSEAEAEADRTTGASKSQPRTSNRDTAPRKRGAAVPGEKAMGKRELVKLGAEPQHAEDFLKARRAKRLAPLTPSVWDRALREFAKAGVTPAEGVRIAAEHGWGSFSADWVAPDGGDRRGALARQQRPTRQEEGLMTLQRMKT